MRLDPRHLRLVLAIVEHGTFNRAAAALNMSQPALSKSIALLEHALDAKLFDRGPRGTSLTPAGHIMARNAQNVDNLIERARAELAAFSHHTEGPLTIGATPSVMLGLLPRALGMMATAHPRTAINVTEGLDGNLIPALERGEIELLIGPLESLHVPGAGIVEIPLVEEDFYVGVPKGHRLQGQTILNISQLSDDAWVLPTAGSSFYRIMEALFLASGTRLPQNYVATNSLPLQELLVGTADRLCLLTPTQIIGRSVPFDIVALENAPFRALGIRHLAGIEISPLGQVLIQYLQEFDSDRLGRGRL